MDSQSTCTTSQCFKCKQSESQQKILRVLQENTSNGSDIGSEVDAKKQIRYGSRYQAAWGIFSEYCDNSTIHGIKYLGEQKRPILERIFWICIFVLSLYLCGGLLTTVWKKWQSNPVIFVIDEKFTTVYQIPFPTVTVCLEPKSKLKDFDIHKVHQPTAKDPRILTEKEQLYTEAIVQICNLQNYRHRTPFVNVSDLIEVLEKVGPDFFDICASCNWRINETYETSFHPILTEEGICHSLNDLAPSDIYRDAVQYDNLSYSDYSDATEYGKAVDWDLENGYTLNAEENSFPYRIFKSGHKNGVKLKFSFANRVKTFVCEYGAEGVKIVLTTPGDIPQVADQFIPIPNQQSVMISIKPEIIRTSEGLRHYSPMSRRCYFQKERYLRYFKLYTESNCKLECLSNFTRKHCQCVKFSMPKTVDTPVCGRGNMKCMFEAAELFSKNEIRRTLKAAAGEFSDEDDCNCLPSCTSISYNVEVSQSELYRNQKKYKNFGSEISKLSIFFKEAQFLTTKRSELYSTTDFLANCGGLLGLLMGVSTLSIVELVYFCTVRMITNLKIRKKKQLQRLQNEIGIATVMDNTP